MNFLKEKHSGNDSLQCRVPFLSLFAVCMCCTCCSLCFSTSILADSVDLRGNSGAAIRLYLLVCVLGGLPEQSGPFTPCVDAKGFCFVVGIVGAVALSHSVTVVTFQECPGGFGFVALLLRLKWNMP